MSLKEILNKKLAKVITVLDWKCPYCKKQLGLKGLRLWTGEDFPKMTSQIQSELLELIDEEEIIKMLEDWKWGFIDKAPFLVEGDNKEVTNLKNSDLAYIYRAINRLTKAIFQQCKQAIRGYCQ